MAQLSFVESMKDRASRLLPNPFTEVVGEATSDLLLTPDWDKMLLVCDHANVPQSTSDVIQAIRNRVDDSSPKVQVLTLVLVETLVKNCGRNVHQELGEKKGLLRDIVNLCVKDAVRDVERDARSAALQLVMNLSHWFARDRDPKVQNLAQIANNARTAGANFTDVEPDTTVALREHVAPPEYLARAHAPAANTAQADAARRRQQNRAQMTRRQQQHQQQQQHAAHGAHGTRGPLHHVVVDAIPIEMPEEAAMANMMETVMLLAELLTAEEDQAATSTQPSAVQSNEVLLGVMQQVQSDHVKMFRLVTCEAPLEGRDALAIVTDSQEAVLQRFELLLNRGVDTTGAGGAHSADPSAHVQGQQQPQGQQQGHHQQGLPPPQDQVAHAQREAQYLQQQTQQYPPAPVPTPPHGGGGASDVTPVPLPSTGHQQEQQQPPAPQPTAPEPHAPTIDELFGQLPSNTDQSAAGPSPPIPAQAATTPIAGGGTTVSGAALEGPSGHAAQDPFAHIRPEPEATAAPHQHHQHHVDATQQDAIADAAMAAFDVTPLDVSAGAGSPSRNRAAADIDEAPTTSAPAPPVQQQQYRSAFPAPAQAMDPRSGPSASEMAKRDTTVDDNTDNKAADTSAEKSAAAAPAQGEAPVAPAHGSINADGIDAVPVVTADDDFDAFLNERLAA